jgi:hypothetical protein
MNTRNSVDQTTYNKIQIARFEPLANPNYREAAPAGYRPSSQVRRSNSMPKLASNASIFNKVAKSDDSGFVPSPAQQYSHSYIDRNRPNESVDTPNNEFLPYNFPTPFKPEYTRRRNALSKEYLDLEFLKTANSYTDNLYLNSLRNNTTNNTRQPARLITDNGTSSFMSTLNQGEMMEETLTNFGDPFDTEYINQQMAMRKLHLIELEAENNRIQQRNKSVMSSMATNEYEKPKARLNSDHFMAAFDLNNQTGIGKVFI